MARHSSTHPVSQGFPVQQRTAGFAHTHNPNGTFATGLRDTAPITGEWPALVSWLPLPKARMRALGSKMLGQSSSSTSFHFLANEDGAGHRKQTFLQVLCDCIVGARPAWLRQLLAALLWSGKRSITPHPHHPKSLTVQPQRAAASWPFSLATRSPRLELGTCSQCQREHFKG